ncbi:unnamed protein product [Absidia cylindrospora]
MDSLMDVDGPEFILEVNEAIAAVRLRKTGQACENFSQQSSVATSGSHRYQLSDLKFNYLKQLLDLAEQERDSLLIVIPWTVILELNGLKGSIRRQQSSDVDKLGDRARKAMRFLETTLQRKSPALRGQRNDEVYDRETNQKVMGDDRILDCCMYFRYHLEKPVLLLSNDRNLSIKAMIHHIDALSAESKSKMSELLALVAKGQRGMQVDPSFLRNSNDIIDEDEDMMDIEDGEDTSSTSSSRITKNEAVSSSGTSRSRYACTIPDERPKALIPERSHWHNEYYRQGMDLRKKPTE